VAETAVGVPSQHTCPLRRIMADHQHCAACLGARRLDQLVEPGGGDLVEPLGRLVQRRQIGAAQQRARQQRARNCPPDRPAICRRPRGPAPTRSNIGRARRRRALRPRHENRSAVSGIAASKLSFWRT
jgi:hypothetical protein